MLYILLDIFYNSSPLLDTFPLFPSSFPFPLLDDSIITEEEDDPLDTSLTSTEKKLRRHSHALGTLIPAPKFHQSIWDHSPGSVSPPKFVSYNGNVYGTNLGGDTDPGLWSQIL